MPKLKKDKDSDFCPGIAKKIRDDNRGVRKQLLNLKRKIYLLPQSRAT